MRVQNNVLLEILKTIFLSMKNGKKMKLRFRKKKIDFRFLDFFLQHFKIFSYFQIFKFFSKSSRFFRFSDFLDFQFFCFKNFKIFRISEFFKKCWYSQISDFLEMFRFFSSQFRYFQIFKYFRNFGFVSQINFKKIEEICKNSRRFVCAHLEYHRTNT